MQKIEEKGLLLPVILRVTGRKHTVPVKREAQRLHLLNHVVDVVIGPSLRMPANRHRCVFRRHTKSIKAHGVKYIMPRRNFITRDHIAHRVVAHMAHMQLTRRIREHLKHIVLRLALLALGAEDSGLLPCVLPSGFNLGGVIAAHCVSLGLCLVLALVIKGFQPRLNRELPLREQRPKIHRLQTVHLPRFLPSL